MRYLPSLTAICLLLGLGVGMLFTVVPAHAQTQQNLLIDQGSASDVCTGFGQRANENFTQTGSPTGMLSDIYTFITKTVKDATKKLFTAFTQSNSYKKALFGAFTLMIIFYGVAFTIGVVQPSFQQVLVRLIKMGVLLTLISPGGWDFFNHYVVGLFQNGTDEIIRGVQQIGTGITAGQNSTPFYALDQLAAFIIQPDTIIAIMGAALSGPFGLTMGGLMIFAVYGFFMLVLKTLRVYAITYVARALILGVAPIFFVFLLFERTKNMFVAWLNSLLNLSLQPILLFTFLSFFIVLLDSSAKSMLGVELCWQEFESIDGTPNKASFWRFIDKKTGAAMVGKMSWKGSYECLLKNGSDGLQGGSKECPEFPINIVDLLSFLILVYLAQRFTEVVDRISSELSNAFVALDNQGRLDQMLDQQQRRGGGSSIFNMPGAGQKRPSGKNPK